jgi:serine/threonine protein kinase
VPSPRSCTRCSKPLALASPGGLCLECAATADTADPTSPGFRRGAPASAVPTATAAHASAQATATANPGGATATGGKEAAEALPNAPAGYDLLDRLGSGGMGSVYLAREQAAERLVAIKFLHQPAGPEALDRFLLELRVLARLDHPNVDRVLASDFLRADPYFTMEYMPGGSLSRAMDAGTPVPTAEAVRLIRTVADAVAAAHAQGVIHRDLKPSNILLTTDGVPKVSDFGLAKRLDCDQDLTQTGAALGTPSYMPPEQISKKNGEIGPWSDVYGLGAALYHLLAGQPPFVGDSSEEVITQVLAGPPRRLRALRPEIPAALEGVVLKCLEKDPKDRYQTVAELAADLDRFTAGQRPVAPPLTPWRRAKRWAKRNRGRLAASAGVLLLAVATALGAILSQSEKPRDYVAESQKKLQAGETLVLVPQKGRPAWSEQPIGGIELSTPIAAEKACVLNSLQNGTLILLPRTRIDRYTVEAEFSQQQVAGPVPQDAHQWCGLLVGYDIAQDPGGGRLHTFFAITFRDFPFANVRDEHAICHAAAIVELPGQTPDAVLGNGKYRISFTPSPGQPGTWRKVKFTVAPDRIQAFWWKDANEGRAETGWEQFAELGPQQIRERIASTQRTLSLNAPSLSLRFPDWSPQNGIAIWCARSAFAVRNVVVTPSVPKS